MSVAEGRHFAVINDELHDDAHLRQSESEQDTASQCDTAEEHEEMEEPRKDYAAPLIGTPDDKKQDELKERILRTASTRVSRRKFAYEDIQHSRTSNEVPKLDSYVMSSVSNASFETALLRESPMPSFERKLLTPKSNIIDLACGELCKSAKRLELED